MESSDQGHQFGSGRNPNEMLQGDDSLDPDSSIFGNTSNPEESLDELYSIVEQCEPDCSICRKLIIQLSHHIRKSHSKSQSIETRNDAKVEEPSGFDTFPSEMPCSSAQITHNLNLSLNYSESNDASGSNLTNNPESNMESNLIRPSTVILPHDNYLSSVNIKFEPNDDQEIQLNFEDPPDEEMTFGIVKTEIFCTESESLSPAAAAAAIAVEQTPFMCKICKAGYPTQIELNIHSRTHARKQTPFWCVYCKKGYNLEYYFERHMKLHTGEENDRPFKCETCGQRFRIRESLKAHNKKHTVGNKYECEECGKCFCQPNILAAHKRTHTGERPFKCNQCDGSFHRKPTLTRHMLTHKKEKPYNCSVCGRDFIRRDKFMEHIREHTGETPYHCETCDSRFTQKQSFLKHVSECNSVNSVSVHMEETETTEEIQQDV